MIKKSEIQLVKETLPLIQKHGTAIMLEMYKVLFEEYPELKMLFNKTHILSEDSPQVVALATAVYNYASEIEHPERLEEKINTIALKHDSISIKPEMYEYVGGSLIKAVCSVLGLEASSPYVAAWASAYGDFADSLIAEERRLSIMREKRKNFWHGFESFIVSAKEAISDNACCIQLKPKSGNKLPCHDAGQYVSLQIPGLEGTRQYSLTNVPNEEYYEIAVKDLDGEFSSYLNQDIQLGDKVLLTMPGGKYIYRPMMTPVVLISAGIGVTPNLGILRMLTDLGAEQPITHIYSISSESEYHFRSELNSLRGLNSKLKQVTFVSKKTELTEEGMVNHRLSKSELISKLKSLTDATFLICGPNGFKSMVFEALNDVGVPLEHINVEFFGPASGEAEQVVPEECAAV